MKTVFRQQFVISAAIVVAALLIACILVVLVPAGEAPDEPAHLAYVEHIVRHGNLPQVTEPSAVNHGEFHQPPLAYALMAITVKMAGFKDIGYPFVGDPEFRFERGDRAMLKPQDTPALTSSRRAVRTARAANLLWLVVIQIMILLMCLRAAASFAAAIASALPFCLAPQLLFICATANNDAAVIAFSSIAVLGLFVIVSENRERPMTATLASAAAGFALWSEISAAFLVPGIVIAVVTSVKARRWRTLAALLVPGLLLTGTWLFFSWARTDSVVPLPPKQIGLAPGSPVRLFTEPWWTVSAWAGFWAKMGWFNLPLPAIFYLAFLPASLAAAAGFLITFGSPRFRSRASLLLALTVMMNAVMLAAYMVRVDWQPQGRYLLPSIVPLAGLCAIGLAWLGRRFNLKAMPRIALVSAVCSFAAAAATILVVAANY